MSKRPDVVFVLGGPGAGKGTQCELIVKVGDIFLTVFFYNLCHIFHFYQPAIITVYYLHILMNYHRYQDVQHVGRRAPGRRCRLHRL